VLGSTVVLASIATGVKLNAVVVVGMLALLQWVGSGLRPSGSMGLDKFVKATENSVVITNKTSGPWKFGYLADAKSEVNDPQSGKFEYSAIDARLEFYDREIALNPDARAVLIPANNGALVLKPRCEKVSTMKWKPFFRVCFIEDAMGNRIFLNIAKGTKDSDTPTVGLAAITYAKAMGSPGSEPRILELYTPPLAKDKKLQRTNLLAIGRESIDPPKRK
jgi:hypothetical protein